MYSNGWGSLIYRAPGNQKKKATSIVTRAFLHRVVEYAKPYKRVIVGVLLAIAIKSALALIPPMLYRAILDKAIPQKDKSLLTELAMGLLAIPIAVGIFGVVKSYYVAKIGSYIINDLRTATYRHLQRSSVRFFTATKTGEVMSRLSNDVRGARNAITDTFVEIVTNVMNVALTLAIMLAIEWRLTLVGLAFLPLFLVPGNVIASKLRVLVREQMDMYATLSAIANQTLNISGVLLTKVFGRAEHNVALYHEKANELRDLSVRISFIGVWFGMGMGLISSLGTVVVYWWGGNLAIDGKLTVGTLVSLTVYLTSLYGPITQLVNSRVKIATSLVSFERVFEILDMDIEIADAPGAVVLDAVDGAIAFDNVSFSYALANYQRIPGAYESYYDDEGSEERSDDGGGIGPAHSVDLAPDSDEEIGLLTAAVPLAPRIKRRRPKMERLPQLRTTERFWPRNIGMSGRIKSEYGVDDRAAASGRSYALNGVSFSVAPGQLAAVVGPSGRARRR
ncbi:ABC transporter ATP-binding protein [Thecamonas trahens ATCC 50062]|uniref:ABC transporter ATP-binding protein n=1 Tax=Thecamonas trahens ATCC 50062 TaxID=461836 RepID=A0A0L0DNI5_THETB|nr:ABC transporter ATP-binding protein [Thecamonas trahens ATCC 50062]KNC52983.1 ABC transporter ATP-binding protein [Thecamonas trahens ATCC 50062]|eukprot:XP_013754872.1 ABC transporter ATP-binding protein [Thecamonas trahens ATCC 50062]